MHKILVLESNSPDIVDRVRAAGKPTAAEHYTNILRTADAGVSVDVVEPYREELSPKDLDGVAGVVLTGSAVPWSVDAPEATALRRAGERIFDAGLPTIGSCNGAQLGVVLLGGAVGRSPKGAEIGLARDIRLTPEGKTHAMMAGRIDRFSVPCIHRDEVQRLPAGAVVTAGNDHCPVQAMAYEADGVRFWGMQYHPELSASAIADDLQDSDGVFLGPETLAADLRAADTDPKAARRLGGTAADLKQGRRTIEVANWLRLVCNR